MNIKRGEIRRVKNAILEFWGRIDKCWPNFSMRAYSIEDRSDVKLLVIRSSKKYRNRLIIYFVFRMDGLLWFREVYRLWGSGDKFRISVARASKTRKDYIEVKIATGYGNYLWIKTIRQKPGENDDKVKKFRKKTSQGSQ